jgi:hypothetical protein
MSILHSYPSDLDLQQRTYSIQSSEIAIPASEHLFDEAVHLTFVTEYGVTWDDMTNGRVKLPPEGANFDIGFEGSVVGAKLNGTIRGVDFLEVRADGRCQLHLHAAITTDNGEKIAVFEDGLLFPPTDDSRIATLRTNFRFTTSSPKYAWVNQIQGWGRGTVDWNTGQASVQAYRA